MEAQRAEVHAKALVDVVAQEVVLSALHLSDEENETEPLAQVAAALPFSKALLNQAAIRLQAQAEKQLVEALLLLLLLLVLQLLLQLLMLQGAPKDWKQEPASELGHQPSPIRFCLAMR